MPKAALHGTALKGRSAHLGDLLKQAPQHGEMGMPVWMIGCFELPSQPPAEPPQRQFRSCVCSCTDFNVWWTARRGCVLLRPVQSSAKPQALMTVPAAIPA